VYFLTGKAVWESRGAHPPTKLLTVQRPLRILEHPNGSIFVLAWQIDGEVNELRGGRSIKRVAMPGRPADMTVRDVWYGLHSIAF
jgi:hypothetical protein